MQRIFISFFSIIFMSFFLMIAIDHENIAFARNDSSAPLKNKTLKSTHIHKEMQGHDIKEEEEGDYDDKDENEDRDDKDDEESEDDEEDREDTKDHKNNKKTDADRDNLNSNKSAHNIYSPPHCQFSIEFPQKPITKRKCEKTDNKRCYDLISFTHIQKNKPPTTIDFKAICNPITAQTFGYYSENISTATLNAMAKNKNLRNTETHFRETKDYKQAGILGERPGTIFIAQLWIAKNSLFSIEATILGQENKAADDIFSAVLKSIHYKNN